MHEFEGQSDRRLPIYLGEPHACPYLPERTALDAFTITSEGRVTSAMYERLMNLGFRRSGTIIYRPVCELCSACVPIRVPVADFAPSRSQRRVARRNADVRVELGRPRCDDARYDLYCRYQRHRHPDRVDSRDAFARFLVDSPIQTLEFAFFTSGRLVGISIVDACPASLSSVYFYYDPAESARSLGVFSGLCEIEECRRRGLAYWYLGYFVRGCAKMEYKARFQPAELLGTDGVWRRMADSDGSKATQ
ncbi:MAG: hypothetical protein AMXMBFR47_07200 [Planctomycetota bacterium]